MRACFRVDASNQIGSGHVMRCMTLADNIRSKGAMATFVSRSHPGHLCELMQHKGFPVVRLPQTDYVKADPSHADAWLGASWSDDAAQTEQAIRDLNTPVDWLVVDQYALDARWETRLRPCVKNIMVIDDLANRPHDCDLLLDQNYYRNLETRYNQLIPDHCLKLLGPAYVLLRDEFRKARKLAKVRSGHVARILLFLGGSDPDNITAKTIHALDQVRRADISVDVVVGASNIRRIDIEEMCRKRPNIDFHFQVDDMARLMLNADMAIGAGGATTWERCLLGLPTLTVVVAENQLQTTLDLSAEGIIWYLGIARELTTEALSEAISCALANPTRLHDLSARAVQFMDIPTISDINPAAATLIENT